MLRAKTRWSIRSPDPAGARRLKETLGVGPLLASLLAARGCTPEEAAFFLSEDFEFHDPFLLQGMKEAVGRIREALARRERLLVYGDYDADGVSAASLMTRLFRSLGADFDVRVPHRVHDGYGLHAHYLEEAASSGITLVVTVDTGITAVEQAEIAKGLGLDLIITDHHEPHETLPDALAVINPKRPDCGYPFRGLAGVGVAFKLAQALLGRVPEELAAYAALGTVADLMPLKGENRSIVKLGLAQLRSAPPAGFGALLDVCGVERGNVSAGTLGFSVGPRINAGGRLDDATEAVRLLVTDDDEEAASIASRLDALNRERQRMVEAAAQEAAAMVEASGGPGEGIVVASASWNPGVIGIVASRLVEAYYRPTVVIALDEESGIGKGSARSVPGFDLFDALKSCESLLEKFGGHESAAGLTVAAERLESFAEAFRREAAARLTDELKTPVTLVDAELAIRDITVEAIEELERLAPFGMEHPAPVFAVRNAQVMEAAVIGKDKRHAKFRLGTGARTIDAVGFGLADAARLIAAGSELSLACELSVNEWNGRRTPQLIVKDVSVAHMQIFDCRSASGAALFRSRWEETRAAGGSPAMLLGPLDDVPEELIPLWNAAPAYRMTAAAGAHAVVPANAAATDAPVGEATDLFLIHCPYPLGGLRDVLEGSRSIGRIHAFALGDHGERFGRELLKTAYVRLRQLGESPEDRAARSLADSVPGLGLALAKLCIRIFRELQFVEEGGSPGTIRVAEKPAKRDLAESGVYRWAERAAEAKRRWRALPADMLKDRLFGHGGGQDERKTEAIG